MRRAIPYLKGRISISEAVRRCTHAIGKKKNSAETPLVRNTFWNQGMYEKNL
jgi:hypothetical protein